jgi:hypothetical protein
VHVVLDTRTPCTEQRQGAVDLDVSYATTLMAAVLLGAGFVLQQYSAEQEPDSHFLHLRIMTDLLRKPRWLLGIACMVAGYLCAAWSIGHLELTLVEPLLTTYLVWALVLAVPMSRQRVKLAEVIGAARRGRRAPRSPGSPPAWSSASRTR